MKGGDDPQQDQSLFVRAQIGYWLLGATDGHAKNFSVFLYPGGGFRATPLYDVMSTQPLLEAGQLRRNRMRLAMAVGDNRHYRVHDILPRHFVQTAGRTGMPEETVTGIMGYLCERMPGAIQAVCDSLPGDFPDALRDAIIGGIEQRLERVPGTIY